MATLMQVTLGDVIALADIVRAAQGNQPVTRLSPDDNTTLITGTARSIGHADFTFAGSEDNIADLFLRVTTRSGMEVAWPIPELLADYHASRLALNYSAAE